MPPLPPRRGAAGRIWLAAIPAALLLPVVIGGFVAHDPASADGARLFAQVVERVERFAVDSVAGDALYEKAARGMVDQLGDPYAELFSPAELASFSREAIGNEYGGLGVLIEDQQGAVTITQVFPHTPAAEGGVLPGDRILRVDSLSTSGRSLDEVSRQLLGPTGSSVTVSFGRAGVPAPITSSFARAMVHVPAVPFAVLVDSGVGYVPLQRFNGSAAAEVVAALSRLQREGARSYVLDVRGNTGGDVDQALVISELFLKEGLELASLRGRDDSVQHYRARRPPLVADAPVVVLTDGGTASASEIVAGALQDHDRAVVVGAESFGKGLVQAVYPLDGGWALKLTTAKWFTPSGRSIQRERGPDGRALPLADSARPVYRSDAGRTLRGGGGIAPDVEVALDTLADVDRAFLRAIAPKSLASYAAVFDLARELRGQVEPDFSVQAAWREDLRRRLEAAGVAFAPGEYEAARGVVDRMLEARVAALAFGDSAVFRREARHDSQLQRAVTLLRSAPTQADLLARVADRG